MTPNNALERTVSHCGRTVRAVALCARAGAQWHRGRPFNGSLDVTKRRRNMDTSAFWHLIEKSRDESSRCEEQAERLVELLRNLNPEDIVEFKNISRNV
jgi:hypothetical protein